VTCTVCPNCGFDLERFEPVERGSLKLEAHQVWWKGRKVSLRASGRLLVSAVVRADGAPVSNAALQEALGVESESNRPENVISVQLCRVRSAFRAIDPEFDGLETVRGTGIRWAI
jgi:DNA-binding response OmpR family regulator